MVRIGLVDVTTSHADAFSKIFNVQKRFRGFRVTRCWDVDRKRSKEVADLYGLEAVDRLADMTDIDAVMVLSRDQNRHLPYVRPFLKKGLPAFVDKTTAGTLRQALTMYSLAKKHKAPIFSASAVRFGREIEDARKAMKKMGKVRFISASGPGELMFYGQHVFDAVYALVGCGAKTIQNVGTDKISLLRIDFKGGLTVQAAISQFGHIPFHFTVADEKAWHAFTIADHGYYYWNMMRAFVRMVKTGVPPFDGRETLEIIDGMCRAKASREKHGRREKIRGKYRI
ncbi:MAG TPA: Gfo/Idh/MocA family oxidoreductase [Planctomycetota bacterium]|nr:Gfo/Idh/MocA family oxidoreductase [Planctomycetota bacterium]